MQIAHNLGSHKSYQKPSNSMYSTLKALENMSLHRYEVVLHWIKFDLYPEIQICLLPLQPVKSRQNSETGTLAFSSMISKLTTL